jgi:hypothetical protein
MLRLKLLLICLCLLPVLTDRVLACTCAPNPPVCEAYADADVVFWGYAETIASSPDAHNMIRIQFRTVTRIKGVPLSETPDYKLVAYTKADCKYPFAVPNKYIVYAEREQISGEARPRIVVSLCSRTRYYGYDNEDYQFTSVNEEVRNQLKTFKMPLLNSGWNIISLPLQPLYSDVSKVLSSISTKFTTIYGYNGSSYDTYSPSSPGSATLTKLDSGRGFYINMREAASFVVCGTPPSNQVAFTSGWNLIGYNRLTNSTLPGPFSSISSRIDSIWGLNSTGGWLTYRPSAPSQATLTTLEAGKGYWLMANQAGTVTY